MVKVPKKWGGCSLNRMLCDLGKITKEMGQQFEETWNAFDQWRRKQSSQIVFTKLYRVFHSKKKKDSIDKARNKMGTFHKLRQYNAATPPKLVHSSWLDGVAAVCRVTPHPHTTSGEWQHYTVGVGSAQKL